MLQILLNTGFGFIHIEQFLIFSAEIHNRSMIAQISTADIKYIVALVKLNHRNMLSIWLWERKQSALFQFYFQ